MKREGKESTKRKQLKRSEVAGKAYLKDTD
jgi:hypothetical protein